MSLAWKVKILIGAIRRQCTKDGVFTGSYADFICLMLKLETRFTID